MIKHRLGSDLDGVILRVAPFASRVPLSPDTLTLLGLAATVGAGLAFASLNSRLAASMMILGGVFDLLDGIVARARNKASRSGAFFDSTLDRIGDLCIYSGLAIGMATQANRAGLLLVLWALGASYITSYSRARAEQELERLSIGFMERPERFACIVAGALTGFLWLALWIVALGATLTSVQRIVVARRLLSEMDRTGVDPTRTTVP